jgi:hypothetical protein
VPIAGAAIVWSGGGGHSAMSTTATAPGTWPLQAGRFVALDSFCQTAAAPQPSTLESCAHILTTTLQGLELGDSSAVTRRTKVAYRCEFHGQAQHAVTAISHRGHRSTMWTPISHAERVTQNVGPAGRPSPTERSASRCCGDASHSGARGAHGGVRGARSGVRGARRRPGRLRGARSRSGMRGGRRGRTTRRGARGGVRGSE